MRKHDVRIGGEYFAKVSGNLVAVKINCINPHGGWDATNTKTNRRIRIKTAARLRSTVSNQHTQKRVRRLNARIAHQGGFTATDFNPVNTYCKYCDSVTVINGVCRLCGAVVTIADEEGARMMKRTKPVVKRVPNEPARKE